jgi:tyrosinase
MYTQVPLVIDSNTRRYLLVLTFLTSVDPLFFLHHANLDRLWAKWEAVSTYSLAEFMKSPLNCVGWKRLFDITGPDTQFAFPYNFFGDKTYKNVTLDFPMFFGNLVAGSPTVPIRNVMDISKMCYKYV